MISAKMVKDLREATGAGMLDCKKALEASNGDFDAAVDWLREKGIAKAAKKETRIAAEGLANIYIDGNNAVILEVNSETDFVAKNNDFKELVDKIGNALLNTDVKTMEEALEVSTDEGKISDLLVSATAKIGEKLSFRRFERVTKNDNEVFGSYLHMGGKIAVLTVVENVSVEVAKDVSMQAAAMRPKYVTIEQVDPKELEHEKSVLKEQAMNEGKPAEIAEKMVEGRLKKFYKEVCLEEQPFIKDGDISVATYVKNNGGKISNMVRYEVGEGIEKREEDFASEVMSQIENS